MLLDFSKLNLLTIIKNIFEHWNVNQQKYHLIKKNSSGTCSNNDIQIDRELSMTVLIGFYVIFIVNYLIIIYIMIVFIMIVQVFIV